MKRAHSATASLNRRWAISFAAIVFAMMTMQMSSLGFSPLIPEMKNAWHMDYAQVGTFTGLYGLVALLVSLPAGLLVKRYGEYRVLICGLALATLGLLAVSFSDDYSQGLASRALWIFGYRLGFVSVMAGVALTVPADWRGKAMGILGACSALATVFGAPFATSIGYDFGWRTGMRAFAIIMLVGVGLFALVYRQKPVEAVAPIIAAPKNNMLAAFKIPIVWAVPLLGLTNAAGFAGTFYVPLIVENQFHLGKPTAAAIISTAYAVAIFLNPLAGWCADRFNRWSVLAFMVTLMIPACVAMKSTDIQLFGVATVMLVSLGHACANQAYPAAVDLLKGREIGPVTGIVALGGGIFGFLGPQLLGSLREASGSFTLGWTAMTVTTTAILVVILLMGRYSARAARV